MMKWGGSYQPGGSVDGAPFIFVYMLLCFVFVRKKKGVGYECVA